VLDQRASVIGDHTGDNWLLTAADRLTEAGFGKQVLLEQTSQVVTGVKNVLGYFSWGSNDTSITKRTFNLSFAPGALAGMFVSTDARTFKEPPPEWTLGKWQDPRTFFAGSPQSLTGDLIREGATGVSGHVAEPYLDATIRPQILFPAYFQGMNLAESYYLAMPFLSWQTVIVGDPLCAPFRTQKLTSELATPTLDPATELPKYFSARRLAVLSEFGVKPEVASLLLKADARLLRGAIAGAREALEAVTVIDPTLNAAHFVLAGLYEQSGEFDLAIARYRKMLENRNDDVRAMNNLAYSLAVHKNNPQEALPLAQRVYKLAANRDLVVDLGYALVNRKGASSAAMPFAYDEGDSAYAQIADTLGWVHHLLGQEQEAERYLTEAVTGAPGNPMVQVHVGTTLFALGRRTEARNAYERAVRLNPEIETADEAKALKAQLDSAAATP